VWQHTHAHTHTHTCTHTRAHVHTHACTHTHTHTHTRCLACLPLPHDPLTQINFIKLLAWEVLNWHVNSGDKDREREIERGYTPIGSPWFRQGTCGRVREREREIPPTLTTTKKPL